ncbi:ER membrane complex subunit 2 [Allomyces arbusculus]|nr:ER membrane complex subunit 2 [Allomyces arbusculus]
MAAVALSFEDAVQELRNQRSSMDVNPYRTVELARLVLKRGRRLGDEVWAVLEQSAMALLDLGMIEEAQKDIDVLDRKFAGSTRVQKLTAMVHEAKGEFDHAMALYNQLLEQRPADMSLMKRKIAVLKSQRRTQDAIAALNLLLDTLPSDAEAWLELADLYASTHMLQPAAHAVEEALLLLPTNHFVHATYADLLYSLGRRDLALKAYCRAVELVPGYVAGLYGVIKCAREVAKDAPATPDAPPRESYEKLAKVAEQALLQAYDQRAVVAGREDSAAVRAARAWLTESEM